MSETRLNSNQINVGNESAIDLLITQNKAKSELASNLQGLGVYANASTDTIEQLAYKVSTVSADNGKQKQANIALDTDERNGDYGNVDHYIVKNGWIFSRRGTSLKYKKLDQIPSKLVNYNNAYNLQMSSKTVSNHNNGYEEQQTIFFNTDGSYMFIKNESNISKYSVSGYDGDTLTFGSPVTLSHSFPDDEHPYISWIDINDAGTKMLITYWVNNDENNDVGLFDLTGSNTQSFVSLNYTEPNTIWMFTNNTTDDVLSIYKYNNASFYIKFYTFSNNTIGSQKGTTYELVKSETYWWLKGLVKYKNGTNDYKIFLHNGGINHSTQPGFIFIDCSNNTISNIFCRTNDQSSEAMEYTLPVTITDISSNHYVISGMLLAIFDSSWNLIGNTINRLVNPNKNMLQMTFIYNNDLYDFSDYNDSRVIYNCMKHKMWLNKLTTYTRTVTQNGISKEISYFAELTATDLDNGWYDI